jgi:uncharacterized protein
MNVVLDTNVLLSAVIWRHLPNEALRVTLTRHRLVQAPETLAELEEVLNRKKFKSLLDRNAIAPAAIMESLLTQCELYSISKSAWKNARTVKIDDPDDLVFIALALESGAKCIVSGDEHLLKLGNVLGIEVLTVAKFMEFYSRS